MSMWEAALIEAYATVPTNVVSLHTIQLQHPAFFDDNGNPTSIRLVLDNQDFTAALVDGGSPVTFTAMAFEITLPEVKSDEQVQCVLSIDNVSRELMRHIEAAVDDGSPIVLVYRPYVSNDTSKPQMQNPLTMELTDVSVNMMRVTATFKFSELITRKFPRKIYTIEEFPGLAV